MYDWLKTFGRYWTRQLERIKRRAQRAAPQQTLDHTTPQPPQPQPDDRQKGSES